MAYHLWIPLTLIYYVGYYWFSIQNNQHGGKWFWIMFGYGALCPMWLLVSRWSKNLFMDGFLYDTVMIVSYVAIMVLCRQGVEFTIHQWVGAALAVMGLTLLYLPKEVWSF